MNQEDTRRLRRQMRHRTGTIGGYIGLGFGLMSLLASASEGTPFARGDGAFLVLGFMIGGYVLGWLLGPVLPGQSAQP